MADRIVLFAGEDASPARAILDSGEAVIAMTEAGASALSTAGLPFERAIDALGDDPEMVLYRAAADWTKAFGSLATDARGRSLRDALRFRSTTLWWWAELYLHHNTDAARRVRFIELVARLLDRERPSRVRTVGLATDETALVERLCAPGHIAFDAGPSTTTVTRHERSALVAGLLDASKVMATAVKASALSENVPTGAIAFVSHAAFWRTRAGPGGAVEDYEHYLDGLLSECRKRGLPAITLGVGPQSTFRTRSAAAKWRERLSISADPRYFHVNNFVTPRLAAESMKAFGLALSVHRAFRDAHSLRTAFAHRSVSFADFSSEDFAFTLLHQAPWAARCVLEFEAAFSRVRPSLVCLYAESSGLGRAAIAAARETGVKTLGIQHGILYPNYFSYERSRDEVASGSPIPDITAMYGEDGVRLLEDTFRYPKGAVVATGSPRYDALEKELRAVDRKERRASLDIGPDERLIVLASRYQGIRDTHKASGPAFPSLLAAVKRIDRARLIVKPHPAEPSDAYEKDIVAAALGDRVRVVLDRALTEILPAADLLVTVESLSATEALVAEVPVVILRHPSNLRDVVASGAAVGVADGVDPFEALTSLLSPGKPKDRWKEARNAYLVDVAHGVDGKSLDRLIDLFQDSSA